MRSHRLHRLPLLAAALLCACSSAEKPLDPNIGVQTNTPRGEHWVAQPRPEPDFALVDGNPYSASNGATVSPRQHLQHVSAWYFGHAT